MQTMTKSEAWNAGYAKGNAQIKNGSKGLVENPCLDTDSEKAWFEGYKVGMEDAYNSAKTGRMFDNPYS